MIKNELWVNFYILKGEGYTLTEIAKKLGISYYSVKYPKLRPERNFLYFFTSKRRKVEDTIHFLGVNSLQSAKAVINNLNMEGFSIRFFDNKYFYMKPNSESIFHADYSNTNYYQTDIETDSQYIAFVTDTHLGSKHAKLEELKQFYKIAHENYGVTDFLHSGDLTDGNGKIYKGHIYELSHIGYDAQKDYVLENYPYYSDVTTHIISGNHDLSFYDETGAHIVKSITAERDDFHYLGDYFQTLTVNGIKIYMIHPKGNQSYALSYKGQRLVEGMELDMLPDILLMGHYHNYVNFYTKNILVYQQNAFQGHTNLSRRKGWENNVGGIIFDLKTFKENKDIKIMPHINILF